MKKIRLFLTGLTLLLICFNFQLAYAIEGAGVYGGGPIYNEGTTPINELRQSGFKWVCVWTIHIMENGDLNFNGDFSIVENGVYMGSNRPDFASNMTLLKTAPTSIEWIEFGLSGWASTTFATVKELVASEGTGPGSTLYENFKALREAIPEIDAISYDDESEYHEPSSTQLAIMLADLGFKVSVCPYTNASHWQNVVANTNNARPGTIEDVHVQCYAGGGGNNPCTWDSYFAPEINVMPGVENSSDIAGKMANWNNQCGITGGWLWIYDYFWGNLSTVQSHASAITNNITAVTTNPPGQAANPNPQSGAGNISISSGLSWSAGSGANTHDVYFGTDPSPDAGESKGNQAGTSYNPGTLALNTTYYWRIDEVNSYGTTTGAVWSFTTGNVVASNLAPDASITASSEYSSDYSKAKMVDGIKGQHGSGEWASSGETTPWAQLNWSQDVVTSKIVLYDRPNSYDHIASATLTFSDGSSVSVGSLPDDGVAETITFSERTITWVKLEVTSGDGPNNGLSEFEVFGEYATSTPSNLALNKPATASSTYSASYEASEAVDGNATSTRWASAVGASQWIYVDLQDTYSISQVVLKWQGAYGKDFTIQVSDDASSWTTIETVTNNSSLTNDLTGLSGTGRYVRMNGTAYGPYSLYSLWEFEVYGTSLKSAVNSVIDKEDSDALTEIKVYPNPATDVFTVESPEMSMTRLTIFDMQGRLVYQNEFEGRIQISTDEISGSGILFIKLASETNTYIQRIVIE